MLEVKNLVKVYKTKGGVETKALDGVTVNFPETGLVFLLGKSGSGKSTLLNMIGGLDRPDSGEIIVKGRSSKDFSQADFDSYRNTFIGFIFQEYNVLNEFNIEQNIALALQLQGKKNDKEAVNKLLKEVDLEGFNKRKPNTLSGGQKQRIAIARALIKQPEIIMADEPTGALDSNTGKQVLETLKKLSKTKLVIIVSHDQDFAEEYGDRIIELKDGKIISDKSKEAVPPQVLNEKMQIINGNIIDIKKGSALTEADFKQLYQLIKKQDKEVLISTGEDNIKTTKKAMRISSDGKGERFSNTKGVEVKKYDGKQTKFIRSHMPFSRSFKMGASGLKTKPIRLIFTILLSVVSFTMFGVASTLMLYDQSYSLASAMSKVERNSEAVAKYYNYVEQWERINTKTGEVVEKDDPRNYSRFTYFGADEVKNLGENKYIGVFDLQEHHNDTFKNTWSNGLTIENSAMTFQEVQVTGDSKDYYSFPAFAGLSDANQSFFSSNGYTLIGNHPQNDKEVAISNYHYELLKESGNYGTINSENELVGKTLKISLRTKNYSSKTIDLKISGVYNFGQLASTYDSLKQPKTNEQSEKKRTDLINGFKSYISGSFYTVGYVAPSFYETYGFIYNNSGNNSLYPSYPQGIRLTTDEYVKEQEIMEEEGSSVFIQDELKDSDVTYYDLDFKPTSKITLGVDEVLLRYEDQYNNAQMTTYYRPLSDKLSTLDTINDNIYEPTTRALVNELSLPFSEEPTLEAAKAYRRIKLYFNNGGKGESSGEYPEGHTLEEDYVAVNTALDAAYAKVLKPYYLERYAYVLGEWRYSDWYADIQPYLDRINDSSNPLSEPELNTFANNVKAPVVADPSLEYYNALILGYIVSDTVNYEYRTQVFDKLAKSLYGEESSYSNVIQLYCDNPTDPDVEANFKSYFEACYKLVYGSEATVDYVFNPQFVDKLPAATLGYTPHFYSKDYHGTFKELTIKGYVAINAQDTYAPMVARDTVKDYLNNGKGGEEDYTSKVTVTTDYVAPEDAKYAYVLASTNYSQSDITAFTRSFGSYGYEMTNSTYKAVSTYTSLIMELKTIFLIIGAVTGGLAALMMLNFISVSISSKNKDIGILRAVGARGSDVFKIFFSESSIIALICFVLSSVGAGITCYELNQMFVESILSVPLLSFGIINIGLILGVAVVISFIATFIPVLIASKKPPVEAL